MTETFDEYDYLEELLNNEVFNRNKSAKNFPKKKIIKRRLIACQWCNDRKIKCVSIIPGLIDCDNCRSRNIKCVLRVQQKRGAKKKEDRESSVQDRESSVQSDNELLYKVIEKILSDPISFPLDINAFI